jgi:hypothetical protein
MNLLRFLKRFFSNSWISVLSYRDHDHKAISSFRRKKCPLCSGSPGSAVYPRFRPLRTSRGPGGTLSLLHREGGSSTLMETELQDIRPAVYPRIKVLFQPTDRTHPHVSCPRCYGSRGRCRQRKTLPGHGGLGPRQTPGTGGFHHLHRVAKGVRDMRGAEGKPFLQGADEQ